jgi:hypothetical protein
MKETTHRQSGKAILIQLNLIELNFKLLKVLRI